MNNKQSLSEKFRDKIIETQEAGLILPRHRKMLVGALEDETLEFRVPQKIIAKVSSRDTDYGFDIFRCSKCGRLYDFRTAIQLKLRCNRCRGRPKLSQAPIFAANFRDRPPTPIQFSEAFQKVTFDWNAKFCIYTDPELRSKQELPWEFLKNPLKGLKEADISRPIYSLCWNCPIPNVPCKYRDHQNFCTRSRYERTNWRPDLWKPTSKRVKLVPRPSKRKSAFGTFVNRYRPVTISEGATKPIRITIHDFSPEDAMKLNFDQEELPGVHEVFYAKKLEIFQFTIALAIGLPYVPIRRRAVRLLSEMGSDGTESYYVLSRRLVTEGIVVKLKKEAVDRVVENWTQSRQDISSSRLKTTLYHTVAHCLLKPLPIISGLNSSEFHASFSPAENEIAVYDNSPGGIGGVRSIIDEGTQGHQLRVDYIAQLLNSIDCMLECSWSCKACLHTSNCGWLNRQLQRQMLGEIINEKLRDRYFGA